MSGNSDRDPSLLDGFTELPEEFQEKIVLAMERGHIDDNDWNGVSTDDPDQLTTKPLAYISN